MSHTSLRTSHMLLGALLIASVAVLSFGHTIRFKFVSYDDDVLVYQNPLVQNMNADSLKGIFTSYDPELYVPLTLLSYQIEYRLSGGHPSLFHATNVFLHTLNAVLFAVFAFFIARNTWIALACGLLFAAHPLHSEAVAWVSARKDLLATFFYLAALLSYLQYKREKVWRWYGWSLVLFALGLLSKITVVTLPVTLVLLDLFQRERLQHWRTTPFFALSMVFGVVALLGKQSNFAQSSTLEKGLLAIKSTVFTAQKLLFPHWLSTDYPFHDAITLWSPAFFIPLIMLILFVAASYWLWRNQSAAGVGLVLFLVMLLPSLSNPYIGGTLSLAADRYAYLPSIGFVLATAVLLWQLWSHIGKYQLAGFLASIGVITCMFIPLTRAQTEVWRFNETLFANVIEQGYESHIAMNNLGAALLRKGDIEGAKHQFLAALELDPSSEDARTNLALVYGKQGDIAAAFHEIRTVLNENKESAVAYLRLGDIYAMEGKQDEAIAAYRFSLMLDPKEFQRHADALSSGN